MSSLWLAPLLMAVLALGWFAVQRAWLASMQHPADSDALQRPSLCGDCSCRSPCPNREHTGDRHPDPEDTAP